MAVPSARTGPRAQSRPAVDAFFGQTVMLRRSLEMALKTGGEGYESLLVVAACATVEWAVAFAVLSDADRDFVLARRVDPTIFAYIANRPGLDESDLRTVLRCAYGVEDALSQRRAAE